MPAFCAMLMKEGVSKKKEVLTTGQVFVEARALARTSGRCCRCCHPAMQPSFRVRVLERGRGHTACAHAGPHTSGTLSLGGIADGGPGCLPDLRSAWPLTLSQFSRRGPALRWGWTARNVAMLAKGRSDVEPEATWRKEARVYVFSLTKGFPVVDGAFLDCIWYFLSSSKPDAPCSNGGRFRGGYLRRERRAGENRLLVREETALLDEQFSSLLMRACCEYPRRPRLDSITTLFGETLVPCQRAWFEWKLLFSCGL